MANSDIYSTPKNRKCPNCGKEFIATHATRKFCAVHIHPVNGKKVNCRDDFHNRTKKLPMYHLTKMVVKISHANRNILHDFFTKKRLQITLSELGSTPFILHRPTNIKVDTSTGRKILFYSDYCLIPIDDKTFKIENCHDET